MRRSLQSRRLKFLVVNLAYFWSLLLALRAVFLIGFSDTPGTELNVLSQALWIGARFDLRLAILLSLPVFFLAYVPWFNLIMSQTAQRISLFYSTAAMAIVLLLYIIDFGHYAYLGIRIDSTALRFLEDTGISSRMIWESYPVIWIALGWLMVLILYFLLARHAVGTFLHKPDPGLNRREFFVAILILLVVGVWGVLGRYSLVPLRWNHAFFSGDPHVAALGLNPVLYFVDTFQFREPVYNIDQVKEYYTDIAGYLGLTETGSTSELNYARFYQSSEHAVVKKGERPPNIIFVMLESLGASRLGVYGNPLNPSPNLDAIARDGWFYENFYVPVSGTSKTVFASVTGLPDVSSVETATRNPFISEQHTIINAFTAHDKYYFIGGSAGWANMGALIKRSIHNVQLFEEGDYTEPEVDVWGISDLSLFREAHARLVKIPPSKPFFAIIQTAGNHRPFTIPEDNEGFKHLEVSDSELNRWGYRSSEQFNAVRLLDHNIGLFLEMARKGGYFDNTIFVFYGDHNNRITQTPHMAPFYEVLDLDGLHVPHMVYAPSLLKPRVIDSVVSLVDVLPTIAGLLGTAYLNTGMGRDINRPHPEDERMVFTQTASKRFPVIGAISKRFMMRMNFDGTDAKLHDLAAEDPAQDVSSQFPERAARMKRLAKGIYETTKYLHHHNSPRAHKAPSVAE